MALRFATPELQCGYAVDKEELMIGSFKASGSAVIQALRHLVHVEPEENRNNYASRSSSASPEVVTACHFF